MRVISQIRPTDIRQPVGDGDDYEAAREAAATQIPDGWQMISYRTERS